MEHNQGSHERVIVSRVVHFGITSEASSDDSVIICPGAAESYKLLKTGHLVCSKNDFDKMPSGELRGLRLGLVRPVSCGADRVVFCLPSLVPISNSCSLLDLLLLTRKSSYKPSRTDYNSILPRER